MNCVGLLSSVGRKGTKGNTLFDCPGPSHFKSQNFKLHVTKTGYGWNCFSCGAGGNPRELAAFLGIDYDDALKKEKAEPVGDPAYKDLQRDYNNTYGSKIPQKSTKRKAVPSQRSE